MVFFAATTPNGPEKQPLGVEGTELDGSSSLTMRDSKNVMKWSLPGDGGAPAKLTLQSPESTIRALFRAVSSAVEHCLHTAGVTGSIPVPPTIPASGTPEDLSIETAASPP